MAITYNAGTDTITVTGYTEGTPCNFTDIYNADVSGAWGKVTRQCTDQFCFDCKLVIGDGSTATWFADENKQIKISSSALTGVLWSVWCAVKTNAHFRTGKVIASAKKTSERGCSFFIETSLSYIYPTLIDGENNDSAVEIYSSQFFFGTASYQRFHRIQGAKVWNCAFNKDMQLYDSTGLDCYNLLWQRTAGSSVVYSGGTFNLLTAYNALRLFELSATTSEDFTISNIILKDNTNIGKVNTNYDAYLINITADTWGFIFIGGTIKIYRQYEFDLKVIDKDNAAINGATVKIWDKDSNLIVDTTTNASGVIATQTITRGYYNQANGNTLQEASPHLIKIEKAGYTMYEADFTLEAKTDWLIALQVGGGLLRNPPMTGGMV